MNQLIRWAINNSPGMNTVMVALLVIGGFCLASMRREEFPEFELERIVIAVPYPGASPEEVEEGICLRIEEAVQSIDGIKKQTSVAAEGMASVVLDLKTSVRDVQKVLNEVRSEIDRIPSFPELAEDPEITQVTMRRSAIRVVVTGPETSDSNAELKLREVAEGVRDDLLLLPSVTQANLTGARDYQIDVEISESTLRQYGLTLTDVARIIGRENLELPAGLLKARSEHVLLRGRDKRITGAEIERIPLVTQADGVVLTVADLGTVRDEFAETVAISEIDGRPGLVISVNMTSSEDLLAIADQVRQFVDERQMPAGYSLRTMRDSSIVVRDRMDLLARNGAQGLLLVFLMLAVFLELRLAFWVSMGIPVSVLGACAILIYMDQTLNMLSMFAFLMALGIVVDDAIVIGENIYAHQEMKKPPLQCAVDGTIEVFPSVFGSVLTSVIAFVPLLFVSGLMGKFIAVLPVTIIAMLVISLLESVLILPTHLAHTDGAFMRTVAVLGYPLLPVVWLFHGINRWSTILLDRFINGVYLRILRFVMHYPVIVLTLALSVLLMSVGFVRSGLIPFEVFPKLDKNDIHARITFQNGTPSSITDAATKRLTAAIQEVAARHQSHSGGPVIETIHRTVGTVESTNPNQGDGGGGSHVGQVVVELVDTGERDVRSTELVNAWREAAGDFPGAESIVFNSMAFGPGGKPVEFKLLARGGGTRQLEAAVEDAKQKLAQYAGVYDVADDSTPGKVEFQLSIRERAQSMGVSLNDLARTVRAAYYGEEVMRLQRGRHEVKLMVRYPDDQRQSLATFDDLRIRTPDGAEYPITELAGITVKRGTTEINRVNQMRSITVEADLDTASGANAKKIVDDLKATFMPGLLQRYPDVRVRWEGQDEETTESVRSMAIGLTVAMVAMYILLTLQFTSYLQPMLIMMIIPFGAIGAIAGHYLLGLSVTMFSLFGLVALTGVVVNDSIVLVDFINQRIRDGVPLREAVVTAGCRRFRPVLLTSVTTVAGLTPILLETSLQAQFLIPMAASLSFGIMTSTALVLVLVPALYCILEFVFGTRLSAS